MDEAEHLLELITSIFEEAEFRLAAPNYQSLLDVCDDEPSAVGTVHLERGELPGCLILAFLSLGVATYRGFEETGYCPDEQFEKYLTVINHLRRCRSGGDAGLH